MNQQTTRPQTATEILRTASETLGERGKQYDPAGKQERSMTAIVAAFNAIYPRTLLTVHMGWQFMSLVKMVRGATKPHADSALDQVAYAALAAEEVAEQLYRAAPTYYPTIDKFFGQMTTSEPTTAERVEQLLGVNQALAEELGKCQHWAGTQSQELKHLEAKAQAAHEAYIQALEHSRSLEVQLDILRASFAAYACRFDLTKEYMTKEQVLAGQAKHEAQVEKLRERECLDIETINDLRTELASCKAANESMTAKFQAERKANVAMHEEVTRLRDKVQELADLAEYRDKRNAELCTELETQRGKCIAQSSRISELQTLVDNLRSSLAQATKEAPCAHNTDEPKAPRPEYVDPFDQYGDTQPLASKPRIVGGADPARGGLAYPNGKPL